MADSQQTVDQQVTSKTPATKQKNPKRVAAGKATAKRTRIAREAQKKALIKAQSIIAQEKRADPVADPPAQPANPPVPPSEPPSDTKNVLTTTQWLSIVSIVVSLAGIYYKREEIKKRFLPKKSRRHRLFCHEHLRLLMPHLKQPSVKWIRLSLRF